MKLKVQLYVDNVNDINLPADYQLIDFFDFESIELTSTIKTVQEPDKVFTDYSRDFVVPASPTNNRVFKHFYSTKLQNGFDARIKRRARIFINGIFFRDGYIRLQSSDIKNGYPYSYRLTFFGALSGLEDIIGEDELITLTALQKYNHDYNVDTVYDGLTKGLQLNTGGMEAFGTGGNNISRDIVYPLISAQNQWVYDSTDIGLDNGAGGRVDELEFRQGFTINLYNEVLSAPDSDYGLDYTQLKPAIKVSHIIEAINEKYESINFSETSFVYSNVFDDLYMLLHNSKGTLSTSSGDFENEESIRLNVFGDNNFELSSGEEFRNNIFTGSVYYRRKGYRTRFEIDLNITVTAPASDILFFVDIYENDTLLKTQKCTSASETITADLASYEDKTWENVYFIVRSLGGLSTFTSTMDITRIYENAFDFNFFNLTEWNDPSIPWTDAETPSTTNYSSVPASYTFLAEIDILKHLPKFKIIDFLKGLFQAFNLVAEVQGDGTINITTLDEYYSNGTERDITTFVDNYDYEVDRVQLFGDFNFMFKEPKTFGIINHNEQLQDDFGNLDYSQTEDGGKSSLLFDKAKYEVKLPFEKLYYNRLTNIDTSVFEQDRLTDICISWLVDKDQEPVKTEPILFYNINTSINTSDFKFGVKGKTPAVHIDSYNRASNVNASGSNTLHFDTETDEFEYEENENSLYSLYYRGYIRNIFNQDARKFKVKAKLPLSFLLRYSLADKIVIDGTFFRINEINTNLQTGISELDLITDFGIVLPEIVDETPPSQVTNVQSLETTSSSITITWNQATDNIAVTNYNIYVDSVLNKTVGSVSSTKIGGLSASTSYDIQVSAVDGAGNEGTLSTVVTIATGVLSDNEAPTQPQNLISTLIGPTAIGIEWDASTDNVAVTGYRVYVDNVLDQTVTNTFANISGLSSSTSYDIQVSAIDSAGNESLRSLILTQSTSA